MARTYGLGGGGLAGVAAGQQRQAANMLGQAANQEQELLLKNESMERERKAGNSQLGGTIGGLAGGAAAGAMYGSSAGPWGTLIGGVLGAVAGGLF